MKPHGSIQNDPFFIVCVLFAFAFHLSFFVLIFVISSFEWRKTPPEFKVTWVQLGGPSGKEEGVAYKESKSLPQTTIEEQKKASFEQPPPGKEKFTPIKEKILEGPQKEKVVIEEKTKKQKKPEVTQEIPQKRPEGRPPRQDPRIAQALAKINEDLKERSPLPEASQVKEGAEGNPLGSPGGSNTECAVYSSRVKQRIVGNWIRIVGSNRPPRPPKIFIRINSSGSIVASQYLQKSGDLSLDSSAMRAVQNSSPLPSPPENCQIALSGGITVQFGR